MIGSRHPANLLTLIGVGVAVLGMVAAGSGRLTAAVAALVIAGLCDLFDGPFARRFDRSRVERAFGVQLDTVADVVSFVALRITVAVAAGVRGWWTVVLVGYALAAVQRLAAFTADAVPGDSPTHYRGLPVTWAALVLSLGALTARWLDLAGVLAVLMALLSVAFVADVPIPKPRGVALLGLLALAVAVLVVLATAGLGVA